MDGVSTSQLISVGANPTGLLIEAKEIKNLLDLNREEILLAFHRYGALIFRGFPLDESIFCTFTERFSSRFIVHASTKNRKPRENDRTIGTVDYGTHFIGPHSELAFLPRPFCPDSLFFHCVTQAKTGGATTVYDGQQIAADLDQDMREFLSKSRLFYRVPVPKEAWTQVLGVNSVQELTQMKTDFRISAGGLGASCLRLVLNSTRFIVSVCLGKNLKELSSVDRHFRIAKLLDSSTAQKDTIFIEWESPILNPTLFSGQEAFVNSLFTGYTSRRGRLNGKKVEHFQSLFKKLLKVCAQYKTPIPWSGGELIMIDNSRMMHGRESFKQSPDAVRHVRTRYGLI